jgi:hypothetical protein
MALVIETTSGPTAGTTTELTLTKPTGTADGNLLVACIASSTNFTVSAAPSGWTLDEDAKGQTPGIIVYWKIASSEGASWTWTFGDTETSAGFVFRISGHDPSTPITDSKQDTAALESAVYDTADVDPVRANNLLIFIIAGGANSSGVSGYAIATSNPTWTEQFDTNLAGGGIRFAIATAPRPETTATGDFSATVTNGGDSTAVTLALDVNPSVTVSPAVIVMGNPVATIIQAPTVTGGANVSPAVVTVTSSAQDPSVALAAAKWSNQSKSSAPSWSNLSKS